MTAKTVGLIAALAICTNSSVEAGKYNKVLSIGDRAPSWSELPGVDGALHSSSDVPDTHVVVIAFTCNSCPYAVDYEDRMIQLSTRMTGRSADVTLIAINCNTVPEDRMEKMKERAQLKKFPFMYLHDESQELGKAFGAKYTPEFFVLDRKRRVIYMGAMDDDTNPDKVTLRYVDIAIEAALQDERPAITETGAVGCAIRYNRARRRKP